MWPCPNCQKLARHVPRRRWTRGRTVAVLFVGAVGTIVIAIATNSVAFGVLLGVMLLAIGFAIAPIQYTALSCESCGHEEEVGK
jgi:hypothetical protein